MKKLTRDDLILALKIVLGLALIIIAFKFFIKLLPVIILLLLILLVYDSFKNNFKKEKKDGVKEAEIISEKKND